MKTNKKKIAIFIPSLIFGGVEQMMRSLAVGFSIHGYEVEVILRGEVKEITSRLPSGVKITYLKASNRLVAPFFLAYHLFFARPHILISGFVYGNGAIILANILAFKPARVIVTEHGASALRFGYAFKLKTKILTLLLIKIYFLANTIIAVSKEVAESLSIISGLPETRIKVIYNPLDLEEIRSECQAASNHPWFKDKNVPVIVTTCRLHPDKDVPTLLRAFAEIRKDRQAKLIIIGEGKQRPELEALVKELNISGDVDIPGFVENAYAYMAKAAVFAFASNTEGFGLVLVEAMTCGCQIVSTDTPSGPREVLDNGKYGKLVPVKDPSALAKAIKEVLDGDIIPKQLLYERANDFSMEKAITQYIDLFE